MSVQTVRDGFGAGRALTARRAVAAGLADRIEPVDAAISRIVERGSVPALTAAEASRLIADCLLPPVSGPLYGAR